MRQSNPLIKPVNRTPGKLSGGIFFGCGDGFGAFFQQQPAQGSQVVEQATAGLQMMFQLVQLELHDLQGLQAALQSGLRGGGKIGCDLGFRFGDGLGQETDVLLGILDAVKRSLQWLVQAENTLAHGKSGGECGIQFWG